MTNKNTETVGEFPPSCGQQSVGASSEDNTGQNIDKEQQNIPSAHAVG